MPPFTYKFRKELKAGEEIQIHARLPSGLNMTNMENMPRILFLYNAKNDEPKNRLLRSKEDKQPGDSLSQYAFLLNDSFRVQTQKHEICN
jgi:hypothetical protein